MAEQETNLLNASVDSGSQHESSQLQSSIVDAEELPNPNQSRLMPQTSLAASATVINLVLATGPFGYPYGFVHLGPVLSLLILVVTAVVSYVCASFVIEGTSTACAENNEGKRRGTMYPSENYPSQEVRAAMNDRDRPIKDSTYYIRQKIEYSKVIEQFHGVSWRSAVIVIIIVYMYGAMCLKYVSGAESLEQVISILAYETRCDWRIAWYQYIDPYYIGLMAFAILSIMFSFGDIENSKVLQNVSMYMRFGVTIVMMIGSIIHMSKHGVNPGPVFDFKNQLPHLPDVFGNTVFAYIFHHSISGIVVPIRPQRAIPKMMFWAHLIGGLFLASEAFLAWLAFGAYNTTTECDKTEFPNNDCFVRNLYNENFLTVPVIGPIANLYPMLNVTAVPILAITLRNNLFEGLELGSKLERIGFPQRLLNMKSYWIKGFWSFVLQIPVIIITSFYRNPQVMLTYTGGLCGAFILMIIPLMIVRGSRLSRPQLRFGPNPYQSYFSSSRAITLIAVFCGIVLLTVVYQIYEQLTSITPPGDPCEAARPPKADPSTWLLQDL